MNNLPAPDRVPLLDLKAQYLSIQGEIDGAIARVVSESAFIGGPYLKSFEEEFRNYCGTSAAVGVSNGTDAVRLALLACGVRPGDEVITVPNTFIATTEAVTMTGAVIRFVDVDPVTLNMSASLLESAITPKTRVILPVHLYGRPANMDAILSVAKRHNLRVVSDCAQAHGAVYGGSGVGSLGDAATFSFYPGKNLGAYGDAGAVVTNDLAMAEKVRKLRDHGRITKYEHEIEGFNCRMDGIQAAILSVKLRHLEKWTELRRKHAERYRSLLKRLPEVRIPSDGENSRAVYHLFVIEIDNRDKVKDFLGTQKIETGIHYPIPLHLQPAYRHLQLTRGCFPVAERSAERVLSLPIFPEMMDSHVDRVVSAVAEAVGSVSARS